MESKSADLIMDLKPKQEFDKHLNDLNSNYDITKLLLNKINSLTIKTRPKSRSGSINELPPYSPTKCLNELNFYKTDYELNDKETNDDNQIKNNQVKSNNNQLGKILQLKQIKNLSDLYLNNSLYSKLPINIQEQFELDSLYSSSSDQSMREWQLDDQAFVLQALNRHNYYRKLHGVPQLIISKNLINYSKDWVEILARNDRLEKRYANRYGENVFVMQLDNESSSLNGAIPVDHWYMKGSKNYDYTDENPKNSTSEFTQVIWKNTKWFGCACKINSKSNKIYVVASYANPANFPKQYIDNVLPKLTK